MCIWQEQSNAEGGRGVEELCKFYLWPTLCVRDLHKLAQTCTSMHSAAVENVTHVSAITCWWKSLFKLFSSPKEKPVEKRKNCRATTRGQAKAIDKVKEDNAPVAPHDIPQGVPGHSGYASVPVCVCVCDLKRYKAHTIPWYTAAKLYMAQSGCSAAPPAAAAGQDAAWAAKNRNRKQRKRNVQKTRKRRQLVSPHTYNIYGGYT